MKMFCYGSVLGKGGRKLKIEIKITEDAAETGITVTCKQLTPEIERMIAMLRMLDRKLTGSKDGELFLLDIAKIIYAESIDRKTFLYTEKEVYECSLRLYELENELEECGFCRASKSCLVQLKAIRSMRMDLNRRIRVTMENGEQLTVSRQYAEGLKERLGVK